MNNYKKHLDSQLTYIPLAYNAKQPNQGFDWSLYQTAKPSQDQMESWFNGHSGNIGVICGEVSNNLVVLDFDDIGLFAQFISVTYPPLLETKWVKSRRGIHLYYFVRDIPEASFSINKLDVKCSGYVVSPPSKVDGHEYVVTSNMPIMTIEKLEYLALDRLTKKHKPPQKPVGSVGSNGRYKSEKHRLIHEIKDRMTIIDALGHYGNDIYIPKNSEKNYISLRCPHPLHEDRHPSFQYFFKDERVYCNTSGCEFNKKHQFDAIDVYRIMNNLTLDQALYELGQSYGLNVEFLE
jgi:hypothetical protein